ncbi:SusD-like starch-binding protein associating with outer membrane [Pedobacter metabolipauper]|uniref:SusD-like starch-binding protein associating with outer membrane n=2 Tax=Pedobacter metabolipauper TaxID=425513 RepID=A0A4R6SQZ2_9SPHI|nr:SusD-like starch-binding protein associating with outer membrane [Pedobacter metabolipauper]
MCTLVTGTILFSSCKKLMDQEPRNSTYDQVFWQNSKDCESALAGNYALLRDVMTSGTFYTSPRYYMYGDAVSTSYLTLQYWGDGLEYIQNGDITGAYNLNSLANWTKYYKAIAMSNLILNKIPSVPDENLKDISNPVKFKQKIIGQALFIRALSYFMMTRVWGDVPLVTTIDEDPITAKHLARSPKADVMKQIEADCHEAAKNLIWGNTTAGEANVTANKGSVYALLAHLYLWRATMTDARSATPNMTDVNSADTTITRIMEDGGYALTDTANYYSTFIGRSREGIFEINASEDSREGSNSSVANMFLRTANIAYNNNNSRAYVTPRYFTTHFFVNKVTEGWVWNEVAWAWEWKSVVTKETDTKDIRFRKNFTDINTDRPTCIKYSNVIYRNPGQKLDAYVSNNIIVFRLSDMRLLQAEIALYKNQVNTATTIINEFRTRNGADVSNQLPSGLTKDAVMNEYVLERGKELYLEGHIFYDLLRTRKYEDFVPWLTSSRFNQEGYYWPVYPALFSNNNLLTQTTYWRGKI